jgi:hypothetical protein
LLAKKTTSRVVPGIVFAGQFVRRDEEVWDADFRGDSRREVALRRGHRGTDRGHRDRASAIAERFDRPLVIARPLCASLLCASLLCASLLCASLVRASLVGAGRRRGDQGTVHAAGKGDHARR